MSYGASSTSPSATCSSVVLAPSICARPSTFSSSGQAYWSCRSCLPTHSDGSTGGCEPAFPIRSGQLESQPANKRQKHLARQRGKLLLRERNRVSCGRIVRDGCRCLAVIFNRLALVA